MIRSLKYLLTILVIILCVCQFAFAKYFYDTSYGTRCSYDDYSTNAKSEWIEYDNDGDGIKEYYYFNQDGYMVKNVTTPDGYTVNDKGQWVVDGVVMHEGAQSNEVLGDELSKQPAVEEKPSEETESNTASKEPLTDISVNSGSDANISGLDLSLSQKKVDTYNTIGTNSLIGQVENAEISFHNVVDQDATNTLILPIEENDIEYNDNTESIENDPTTIPPKAKEAINVIKHLCNEDGEIIIPSSKKSIKLKLKVLGYKNEIINRAITECGVDWNGHALIIARAIKDRHNTPDDNYNNNDIARVLKALGFNSIEIEYAIKKLNIDYSKRYINFSDFKGLTQEECINKLSLYELKEDQVQQALNFIKDIE